MGRRAGGGKARRPANHGGWECHSPIRVRSTHDLDGVFCRTIALTELEAKIMGGANYAETNRRTSQTHRRSGDRAGGVGMRASVLEGLGTALKTLTLIPWPRKESEDFPSSLPWFPVVGLFLGLIIYGVGLPWNLLPLFRWPAGVALFMVAAEIWLTRGIHLDGLADWADSIGGFLQREKRLAIMKDTSLGAFGGLALIVVLLAKWVALERLFISGSLIWLLPVFVISRDMMVELITTLPYARAGEGTARAFVSHASPKHRLVSHAVSLLLCIPFGPLGLVLIGVALFEARLFGVRLKSRFGGITGDLLGTANEIIGLSLLILCALPGKGILSYTGWAWMIQNGP